MDLNLKGGVKLCTELPLEKPPEHKSRVLSATADEGSQSAARIIEQVTKRENNDSADAQNSQLGSQQNEDEKQVI